MESRDVPGGVRDGVGQLPHLHRDVPVPSLHCAIGRWVVGGHEVTPPAQALEDVTPQTRTELGSPVRHNRARYSEYREHVRLVEHPGLPGGCLSRRREQHDVSGEPVDDHE